LPGSSTSKQPGTSATPPGTIKELELDVLGGLNQITFDRNGNLWYAGASSLGWISPSGKATNIDIRGQGRTFFDLTAGPDGKVWFLGSPIGLRSTGGSPIAQGASESVGYVGTNGQIQQWQFPASGIGIYPTLQYLVAGPDGNVWYARSDGVTCFIGRITPTGSRTEFTVFTGEGRFSGLAVGPDGNLWFGISQYTVAFNFQTFSATLLYTGGLLGRITPSGTIQRVSYPFAASYPEGFLHGYDGNLWFVVYRIVNGEPAGSGGYGIIDRTGTVAKAAASAVGDAVRGSDGNLWSIDQARNAIRRVTVSGTVTEYTIPTANAQALDLVSGKDGNLWFAEARDKIARITPSGEITEFTITSPGAIIQNLIVGPDGDLWFDEHFAPPNHNVQNIVGDIGSVTV
jgi:virginiamycin B lyase